MGSSVKVGGWKGWTFRDNGTRVVGIVAVNIGGRRLKDVVVLMCHGVGESGTSPPKNAARLFIKLIVTAIAVNANHAIVITTRCHNKHEILQLLVWWQIIVQQWMEYWSNHHVATVDLLFKWSQLRQELVCREAMVNPYPISTYTSTSNPEEIGDWNLWWLSIGWVGGHSNSHIKLWAVVDIGVVNGQLRPSCCQEVFFGWC